MFTTEWISSTLAASGRKPTTKALYATIARKHIVESTIGTTTLARLRPSHVEAWTVQLRRRGLSESTTRTAYTVLRAVLDTAVRDEALAKNPATAVARPKVTRREAAHLTPAQARCLLDQAARSRYAALFDLLLRTGMRRGEALALTWRDVDLERARVRVRGTLARVDGELVVVAPKTTKSERTLHLSPAAAALLRAVRSRQRSERLRAGSVWEGSPYVFTTETGGPCDPRNALRALKAAAVRAGLTTDIGLHTLRHSAASVMLADGVPLKVVSEVLGHSSVAITGDVYGHVAPDVAASALDALSSALG